jgi:hypothetical protein
MFNEQNLSKMKIIRFKSLHFSKWLLLISAICSPSIALADRYGICEGTNCGGGTINGIFGALLILAFLAFIGFKKAGIYLFVWLAPVYLAVSLDQDGLAALWGLLGFYLSIFITAWIVDFFNLDNKSKTDENNEG